MNCSCASCHIPSHAGFFQPCDKTLDPLIPAKLNARPAQRKQQRGTQNRRPVNNRKQQCNKIEEPCTCESLNALKKSSSSKSIHPSDCACLECERAQNAQKDQVTLKKSPSQESICISPSNMSRQHSERSMKNYMHDNPELSEVSYKDSSACADLIDCIGPNSDVYVLQCPKGLDLKSLMNTKLGKLQSDKSKKVDFTVKCFKEKMSLACLTPEKATEYEIVCDNIKILRPIGKIVVTEDKIDARKSSSNILLADVCESDENVDEPCEAPVASKRIKKKFNDQKFTIETTVTVESCNDRKRSKKIKEEPCDECISLVPPEPVIPTKRQKKKTNKEDLSWMDC